MPQVYLENHNRADVYTEEERQQSDEPEAPLVKGWTEFGPFTANSLEEVVTSAKNAITKALADNQNDDPDKPRYVAELAVQMAFCEKIQNGELKPVPTQ